MVACTGALGLIAPNASASAGLARAALRVSIGMALATLAIGATLAIAALVLRSLDAEELAVNRLLLTTRPFRYADPVEAALGATARSLVLLVPAVGGGALLGVGLALAHRGIRVAPLRGAIWTLGLVAAALPAFFWALLAEFAIILVFFATGRHILPFEGYGLDEHLVLPVLTLGLRPLAVVFRATSIALDEIMARDHVTAARAKGVPEDLLLVRHVLPNLAPDVVAGAAYAARNALSSLAIVEFVYSWGGAGLTFLQAVILADAPRALAILVVFVVLHLALGAAARGAIAASVRRT